MKMENILNKKIIEYQLLKNLERDNFNNFFMNIDV
jgi:hypothetical protein